jgi:hypothetical protein
MDRTSTCKSYLEALVMIMMVMTVVVVVVVMMLIHLSHIHHIAHTHSYFSDCSSIIFFTSSELLHPTDEAALDSLPESASCARRRDKCACAAESCTRSSAASSDDGGGAHFAAAAAAGVVAEVGGSRLVTSSGLAAANFASLCARAVVSLSICFKSCCLSCANLSACACKKLYGLGVLFENQHTCITRSLALVRFSPTSRN